MTIFLCKKIDVRHIKRLKITNPQNSMLMLQLDFKKVKNDLDFYRSIRDAKSVISYFRKIYKSNLYVSIININRLAKYTVYDIVSLSPNEIDISSLTLEKSVYDSAKNCFSAFGRYILNVFDENEIAVGYSYNNKKVIVELNNNLKYSELKQNLMFKQQKIKNLKLLDKYVLYARSKRDLKKNIELIRINNRQIENKIDIAIKARLRDLNFI